MKTNFRKNESTPSQSEDSNEDSGKKDLTQKEFEEYIAKSGAKGSFMVYRSTKKDEELGLDEL
ncbi:hypothetical protein NZNM25_19280 [Nitrosopumilus zosterae]|uniref:Uncharacterized protein n=1 Tax=Nitrosopumilus zosterae TaxID=718286 RepID=A0A2S2KUA4_9ARCH|nr:hypothetical protein [Nitrosopumilus zosterae]BDQ31787.1 hypothetical protein NZOSNM25_001925 [Nitrosopumilus zosterae]GBH35137.1 hypothetical protein NZNM25_19280 [Nitrosopumilus zosterae]